MLKKYFVLFLFSLPFLVNAQSILNMEILSNIQFGESGNDIWGFVDDEGTEYAVIGTRTATRIYSLEDPANPIERYVVSGSPSTWRDIKFYRDFLYITTDTGADGLTIIDCTNAPDNFSFTRWKPIIETPTQSGVLDKAHNLYIDTLTGIGYISGHNVGSEGVLVIDLKEDPNEPVILSVIDEFYSHDSYVNDNLLYSSELTDGLAVYDVSDPANPIEIIRQETSRQFCHNAWSTPDNKYVFTTDERSSAYLDAYDVSSKSDAIFLDKYRPLESLEWPVIPHNTHIMGDYAITSWYTDGVVITDISNPSNIVRVGQYDTFTDEESLNPNGQWFEGCWGAYPYLPSGLVLVSDINTGLYILQPKYQRAGFLEGKVTSKVPFELGKAISGATVEILDNQLAYDVTKTSGLYKTGIAGGGSIKVAVNHPNYIPDTFTVDLVEGQITNMDFELNASYLATSVIEKDSEEPIQDAKIVLRNRETNDVSEITTDINGEALIAVNSGSTYDIFVAKWGYLHEVSIDVNMEDGENTQEITLSIGYQDDFFADLGWEIDHQAASGEWELGSPIGTVSDGNLSNPANDVTSDIGESCYTTGNTAGSAGTNDIDDGVTTLISPSVSASEWEGITIEYNYWFHNSGGNDVPDDTLIIALTNGVDEYILEKITESSSSWSNKRSFDIFDSALKMTDDVRLVVSAGDYGEGHLAEAAIDAVRFFELKTNSIDPNNIASIEVFPNPVSSILNIKLDKVSQGSLTIVNDLGQIVLQQDVSDQNITLDLSTLTTGLYIINVETTNGKLVKSFFKN